MRRVDTDALQFVSPALGVGNPATLVQDVVFDDDNLQQTFGVERLVASQRNSKYGGIWAGWFSNTHPGADSQSATIDPYGLIPGSTCLAPWPDPDEMRAFDVWLLGPLICTTSVTGAIGLAQLRSGFPASQQLNFDVIGATNIPYAIYDSDITVLAGNFVGILAGSGDARLDGAWRLPRGTSLDWVTTSTAAADIDVRFRLGVWPRGAGQDAFGAG